MNPTPISAAILSLPCDPEAFTTGEQDPENLAYCAGHRAALKAAAALVIPLEERVRELEADADAGITVLEGLARIVKESEDDGQLGAALRARLRHKFLLEKFPKE